MELLIEYVRSGFNITGGLEGSGIAVDQVKFSVSSRGRRSIEWRARFPISGFEFGWVFKMARNVYKLEGKEYDRWMMIIIDWFKINYSK